MKIGLIGNQNSGKSSLFNILTHSNEMVGNWAGVTVDKKKIVIDKNEYIDLPGIYSLNPFTEEEKITVNYLNKLDVIINIIDATNLERSLYLTLQLIDLKKPMVLVLTKKDLLKKKNIILNLERLKYEIDIPLILISNNDLNITNDIKKLINKAKISNLSFNNINIEEGAYKKYQYINKICSKVIKKHEKESKLDKFILNRYLAIPIFFLIMFLIYYLSFNGISLYLSDYIEKSFANISNVIEHSNLSPILISLINNSIINSIGTIMSFVPSLFFLFFFITILEASGYMSRISFIMDKLFRKIGLSGKSIIPFIIGSSCSVPAILSTRMIENKHERYMTAMLTSVIPCSAKMTIIMLFIKMIFKDNYGIHFFIVYLLSILIIIVLSLIFKKYLFKSTTNYYLNEITQYQIPSLKLVLKTVYYKIKNFIIKITKTIIISSIIIWILCSIDFSFHFVSIDNSILGFISNKLSFIFYPILGEKNYQASLAIMQGVIAKEQVTSSLIISSKLNRIEVTNIFKNDVATYAFMIFNLFCFPCINAIITLKKEIGLKLTLFNVLFQTLFALLLSTLIYQIGIIILHI